MKFIIAISSRLGTKERGWLYYNLKNHISIDLIFVNKKIAWILYVELEILHVTAGAVHPEVATVVASNCTGTGKPMFSAIRTNHCPAFTIFIWFSAPGDKLFQPFVSPPSLCWLKLDYLYLNKF